VRHVSFNRVECHTIGYQRKLLAQMLAQPAGAHAQVQQSLAWLNQVGNQGQGVVGVTSNGALVHMLA